MKQPSQSQLAFSEKALEIITPLVKQFGFELHLQEVQEYSTRIVWRKGAQYVEISGSDYPTDYPYNYNIVLGEGSSDDFLEYDWNAVAIWAMAKVISPETGIGSYPFPIDNNIVPSLKLAASHLNQFGHTFLSGDLKFFYEARKQVNEKRQPYKIYTKDKDGKPQVMTDEESLKQKKKYS